MRGLDSHTFDQFPPRASPRIAGVTAEVEAAHANVTEHGLATDIPLHREIETALALHGGEGLIADRVEPVALSVDLLAATTRGAPDGRPMMTRML